MLGGLLVEAVQQLRINGPGSCGGSALGLKIFAEVKNFLLRRAAAADGKQLVENARDRVAAAFVSRGGRRGGGFLRRQRRAAFGLKGGQRLLMQLAAFLFGFFNAAQGAERVNPLHGIAEQGDQLLVHDLRPGHDLIHDLLQQSACPAQIVKADHRRRAFDGVGHAVQLFNGGIGAAVQLQSVQTAAHLGQIALHLAQEFSCNLIGRRVVHLPVPS